TASQPIPKATSIRPKPIVVSVCRNSCTRASHRSRRPIRACCGPRRSKEETTRSTGSACAFCASCGFFLLRHPDHILIARHLTRVERFCDFRHRRKQLNETPAADLAGHLGVWVVIGEV